MSWQTSKLTTNVMKAQLMFPRMNLQWSWPHSAWSLDQQQLHWTMIVWKKRVYCFFCLWLGRFGLASHCTTSLKRRQTAWINPCLQCMTANSSVLLITVLSWIQASVNSLLIMLYLWLCLWCPFSEAMSSEQWIVCTFPPFSSCMACCQYINLLSCHLMAQGTCRWKVPFDLLFVYAVKPFDYDDGQVFKPAPLSSLPWQGVLLGMGLGFCLSLLFFMDQNISQSMVNSPDNKWVHPCGG